MDDDLNVPEAVGRLFAAIRDLNRLLDATTPSAAVRPTLVAMVDQADDVLGVLPLADRERAGSSLGAEEEVLLARRVAVRAGRDFAESDRIRAELLQRGIIVEDTPQGQRWKRA
jgi:cysteinyl-tRNA synthetase